MADEITTTWREFGVTRGSGLHPAVQYCCREGDSGHLPGPHTHVRTCQPGILDAPWEPINVSG